jgi:FAD/FMN-containing dehydrogenase
MRRIQGFEGRQLVPGSDGYDEARTVHNAMVDRRPALIAQCATSEDVVRAVLHAQREGVDLAVRAGGHSVAGMSLVDGGLVIDVRGLDEIAVDPERRTVRAGAGITWAALDRATQAHGLATTGGRVSTTGVAGLTLGGGSGWLERSLGLACDALIGAELVTAGGDVVHVGGDEHPELLWALRGGGGNVGVVTALELRLAEVGPIVYGGVVMHDPADGPALARGLRDLMRDAPDACGMVMAYLAAPEEDIVPPAWRGRQVFVLAGCWNGPVADGERALRPLLDAAPAVADLFGEVPYVELQCMIDDPPGFRNWWTADYLADLPDEAIDAFVAYATSAPQELSQTLLVPWGGAVARLAGGTPLANRDAAWVVHPFAVWEDPARDADHVAWGRASHEVFAPWATGGTYLNFIGDEGDERVRAAFGESYDRLVAVKTAWDPGNVFRANQNIRPRRRPAAVR